MKFLKTIFILSFFSIPTLLPAQTTAIPSISFIPVYENSQIGTNGNFYKITTGDSASFETLKFYISGIEFRNNEQTIWKEENSFHLMDMSDKSSMVVRLNKPVQSSFNNIQFHLGIDSLTNVSGALGGDLDPTKGMYWTWQNGYINFKLEGKSNLCKTRNNEFEFHLGGYQFPNNSFQTVTLPCTLKENILISFDLEKFLSQVDLRNENQIMSPGNDANLLSKKAASAFSVMK